MFTKWQTDFALRIKRAAKAAFRAGHEAATQRALESTLEAQDEKALFAVVGRAIEATQRALESTLEPLLLATLTTTGTAAAKALKAQLKASSSLRSAAPPAVKGFAFDVTNKKATAWAHAHAGETIKGISETTREEIRDLVEEAFSQQFDVDDLAKEIGRVLGDDARAETIARTESMRAANEGQSQLWDQATEAGLLTGNEKQEWIVTPDDRLCPICEPMDGVTVGLDEMFDVDGDQIDGPPAHPNCRCTLGLSV